MQLRTLPTAPPADAPKAESEARATPPSLHETAHSVGDPAKPAAPMTIATDDVTADHRPPPLHKAAAPASGQLAAQFSLSPHSAPLETGLEGQVQHSALSQVPAHATALTSPTLPSGAPPPLVHAPPPYQQTAQQIIGTAQGKVPPITELTLAPEELGRLRFEIATQDDHLTVRLFIERPDTLDLMRRQSDQLLSELRQAGFAQASLSFSGWGHGQNHTARAQAAGRALEAGAESSPALPVPPPAQTPLTSATGRLHIRL